MQVFICSWAQRKRLTVLLLPVVLIAAINSQPAMAIDPALSIAHNASASPFTPLPKTGDSPSTNKVEKTAARKAYDSSYNAYMASHVGEIDAPNEAMIVAYRDAEIDSQARYEAAKKAWAARTIAEPPPKYRDTREVYQACYDASYEAARDAYMVEHADKSGNFESLADNYAKQVASAAASKANSQATDDLKAIAKAQAALKALAATKVNPWYKRGWSLFNECMDSLAETAAPVQPVYVLNPFGSCTASCAHNPFGYPVTTNTRLMPDSFTSLPRPSPDYSLPGWNGTPAQQMQFYGHF